MATLTIRKFDDEAYQRLGERAKRNNRSMEAEARDILVRETKEFDIKIWVDDLREFRKDHAIKPRPGEDSVSMIRAIRDE